MTTILYSLALVIAGYFLRRVHEWFLERVWGEPEWKTHLAESYRPITVHTTYVAKRVVVVQPRCSRLHVKATDILGYRAIGDPPNTKRGKIYPGTLESWNGTDRNCARS